MLTLLLTLAALAVVGVFLRMLHRGAGGFAFRLLGGDAGVVTLAEAQNNAQDAISVSVIDEFRRNALLDLLQFDDSVSPTGGGTLTYGYRRLVTAGTAATRALNTEYTPQEATTTKASVDLEAATERLEVDRVIGRVGPAASGAVSLNMSQKVAGARAEFGRLFIQGDTAVDADDFDGLDKILTGSSTEVTVGDDWTVTGEDAAFAVLDFLDDFLAVLNGDPGAIIANRKALAKIRAAARRAGYFTQSEGAAGSTIQRYNGIALIDAGQLPNSNTDVIPVEDRNLDGSVDASGNPTFTENERGLTDIYAVRFGLDGTHGVSMAGAPLVQTWLPDFSTAGAVKTGEVEMGPVGVVVKATKSAAVARNIKVQ
jgi:hypothetical protein